MSRPGPTSFLQELRRRRVLNTIAIYIVGAWVVLQVTELALPALDIPDHAIRHVWLTSFALFPLVLLFGWRYDISTDGIRKSRTSTDAPESHSPLSNGDRWYIGALSLLGMALIATALLRIARTEPDDPLPAPNKDFSVAVLPFDVCEEQQNDLPLGAALSEEVRYRLAEQTTLKVMMRNSTEQLAGSGLPRTTIARLLDVQFLVSGTVCREDGVLNMTSRLSDRGNTITGQWQHEQTVNDFGQIVSPLATQVVRAIAAAMGTRFDGISDKPVNRVAYERFLVGRERTRSGDLEEALEAFGQALELEPEFAEAIAWKAQASVQQARHGPLASQPAEALQMAEAALSAVNRQIRFNANNAHTQFVAGIINYDMGGWLAMSGADAEAGQDALARSENHFRAARAMNPSLTGPGRMNIDSYLAETLMRMGIDRRAEALETYEDGFALDPWNAWHSASLAQARAERGRYREAVELLDRYRQLPTVPDWIWRARRQIVLSNGHYDMDGRAQLWIRRNEPEKLAPGLETRLDYIDFFTRVLTDLGLKQESNAVFSLIGEAQIPTLRSADAGQALAAERAASGHGPAWWNSQRTHEAAAKPMMLVELLFSTGRPDDAIPVLDDVLRHLEAAHDTGNRHPQTLRYLAEAHAYLGHDDEALDMLEKAVDYHLRDPDLDSANRWYSPWAHLRTNPRFVTQLNIIQSDLGQQAETVRAMLSNHELDELLAPLMSSGGE